VLIAGGIAPYSAAGVPRGAESEAVAHPAASGTFGLR